MRQALNRGVRTGSLKQVSGTGASGSFCLGDTESEKIAKKTSPQKAKGNPKNSAKTKSASEESNTESENKVSSEGESPVNNGSKSTKTRGLKRTAPTTNKSGEKSTRVSFLWRSSYENIRLS